MIGSQNGKGAYTTLQIAAVWSQAVAGKLSNCSIERQVIGAALMLGIRP